MRDESSSAIDPDAPPSGEGCVECLATSGWWLHLRRCARCGHIGCCESSPSQHASKHAREPRHPIAQSFEPGEDWFWDYAARAYVEGPKLAPPDSRPIGQGSPAPRELVPADWRSRLHRDVVTPPRSTRS